MCSKAYKIVTLKNVLYCFAESYNVTYFFETLPAEFDEWNLNQRVAYFSTWLLGYADLPQFLQVNHYALTNILLSQDV